MQVILYEVACYFFIMKNIVCKNSWRTVNPKTTGGITRIFIHGIEIRRNGRILNTIVFPFLAETTLHGVKFTKDGEVTYVGFSEVEETREQIMQIIQTCAIGTYGSPMQRRTTGAIAIDTDPVQEVDLTPYMQAGDVLAGIYDVYAPNYVNEGLLPEDYTVLLNGNIRFNTEIPVEPEPYVITINFWVTQ